MKQLVVAGGVLAALAGLAHAQAQKVTPPIAVYWVSAETSAGMGMAMPAGYGGMLPPGMQGGKRVRLDLGSQQGASGSPRADHAIPQGLAMGRSLPLLSPEAQRAAAGPTEDVERNYEPPKGRMLIYWGCGETVRQGQPVVIDFSRLGTAEAGKAMRSRNVSRPTGPAQGRNRTYGEWPNRENSTQVPDRASLVGDHNVAGNYSPEIRFSVDDRHDFMAPVAFDGVRRTGAGAFQVRWQSIPTAIGYFATATGMGETQNDIVMWSSSEVQEMGHALMDYLPPAEVARLIKERIVMTPQTTECTVPAGIFKGEGAMLNFIAYGDELNVVHPPRPKDPKQPWNQEYAVKVRLKSTGMTMLADGAGRAQAPAGREQIPQQPGFGGAAQQQQQPARAPTGADAVQEGFNLLRGILGR